MPLPGALTQFLKKLRFTGLIWLLDNIYIILCLWYVDFNNINSNNMIKTDIMRVSTERLQYTDVRWRRPEPRI